MSINADGSLLLLGKGKLFFDRFTTAGVSTGLRYLGDVTGFTIKMSDETKDAYSSSEAGAPLLKSALIRRTVEMGCTLKEFSTENAALALMGTVDLTGTQSAGAVVSADQGCIAVPDRVHQLKARHLDPATPAVVKVDTSGTALTVTTDYTVDYENGTVYLVSNATTIAACNGTKTLWVGYTKLAYAAGAYPLISGGAQGVVEGHFYFVGDPSSGPKYNADLWRVDVTPDGEWGLIADDFGEFKLKGKVVSDATAHPSSPNFLITRVA